MPTERSTRPSGCADAVAFQSNGTVVFADAAPGRADVREHAPRDERAMREEPDGRDAPEVHDALDLCLSCKGCARDCPTGIDMASYKSTVLDHSYAGRLRPRSHYALGWLPRWGRMITRVPGLAALINLPVKEVAIARPSAQPA